MASTDYRQTQGAPGARRNFRPIISPASEGGCISRRVGLKGGARQGRTYDSRVMLGGREEGTIAIRLARINGGH
jgi:hypothetical protein